ncbi:unnamed protein product [Parajaminaea phylloscopi]
MQALKMATGSRHLPQISFDLSPPEGISQLVEAHSASCGSETVTQAQAASLLADIKPHFARSVPLLAIRVPAKDLGHLRKASDNGLSDLILRVPRISSIVDDIAQDANGRSSTERGPTKLLLLGVSTREQIPANLHRELSQKGYDIVEHKVDVGYDWYSADDVLASILPNFGETSAGEGSAGTPTGYTSIGHIAHLNLRDHFLPYRFLIGQVILDKNAPAIRTVVNKLDSIDNEFRFFAMELLAGEAEYTVTSSESGCLFTFDFRKVYFNSRLHTEHARIVALMGQGDVVVDVMAGVGPFALPAAKSRGCRVYANDLNPSSYESLKANAVKNRVDQGVGSFCEDGRAFIRDSVCRVWNQEVGKEWKGIVVSRTKEEKAKRKARLATDGEPSTTLEETASGKELVTPPSRLTDHFIMNLPATAIEFLDAYRGLYTALAHKISGGCEAIRAEMQAKSRDNPRGGRPFVHVHTFTKDMEDPAGDICRRANEALGLTQDHPERLIAPEASQITTSAQDSKTTAAAEMPDCSLHWVRKVAPNKDMYCLSFRIPDAVLFSEHQ